MVSLFSLIFESEDHCQDKGACKRNDDHDEPVYKVCHSLLADKCRDRKETVLCDIKGYLKQTAHDTADTGCDRCSYHRTFQLQCDTVESRLRDPHQSGNT